MQQAASGSMSEFKAHRGAVPRKAARGLRCVFHPVLGNSSLLRGWILCLVWRNIWIAGDRAQVGCVQSECVSVRL